MSNIIISGTKSKHSSASYDPQDLEEYLHTTEYFSMSKPNIIVSSETLATKGDQKYYKRTIRPIYRRREV